MMESYRRVVDGSELVELSVIRRSNPDVVLHIFEKLTLVRPRDTWPAR
jgi:hypothetical protein